MRHGVARIHGKIEQHLMQLGRIALNRAKFVRTTSLDFDGFRKRLARDVDHLVDEMARPNRHALAFDASRKRKHLFHDDCAAPGAIFDQRDCGMRIEVLPSKLKSA